MIEFLTQSSGVLLAIFLVSLLMWFLILDRYWYLLFRKKQFVGKTIQDWETTIPGKTVWEQLAIRDCYISQFRHTMGANVEMIKALVSISMLLGLLGTIVGMIHVFENLVLTELTGVRGLVNGVSQTIIPAMAGLMVSLSGLYFVMQIEKLVNQVVYHLSHCLSLQS